MLNRISHNHHRLAQAAASAVFYCLVTILTSSAANAADNALFGTQEIRSTNLAAFTKWTSMLSRGNDRVAANSDGPFDASECEPNPRLPCDDEALYVLIRDLQSKGRQEQLDQVNRFMNGVHYVTDDVNWGVADYWATPQEFLGRDGDCEDFAIAKYAVLKRLGFASKEMRVVVLEDQNLRTHHAILMVGGENGQMILDNQISDVVPATSIHHYRPVYSISEGVWWLHVPSEGAPLIANKSNNN